MNAPGRRERKKQQTRQAISDTATQLFLAHGFDAVTVSQIATHADVAVQTVFNHFPTKEDLFFDDLQWVTGPAEAVRAAPGRPPVVVLDSGYRADLARRVARGYLGSSPRFFQTIESSPALRARRAHLTERLTTELVAALTETHPTPDPPAWRVALLAGRYAATRQVLDAELVRLVHELGPDEAPAALDPIIAEAFASLGG